MNYEEKIMQIIINGGDAKSKAIKSLREFRQGNIEGGNKLFEEGKSSLNSAHNIQTKLIQSEVRGEEVPASLLMIHAQDHLMNAITVMDLVKEMREELISIHELRNDFKHFLGGNANG